MMKKLFKRLAIAASLFAFTPVMAQTAVNIDVAANEIPVTTVAAGGTFEVTVDYTSDEIIEGLTAELEFVSFGGGGTATFVVDGSGETKTNVSAAASNTSITFTLTFPSENPIDDDGNEWKICDAGGTCAESDLRRNNSTGVGYRVKFSTDNADDTITGSVLGGAAGNGGGDFPTTGITNIEFRNLDIQEITGVAVPPVTESIKLVSVYNAASNGVATNPIAEVARGATFPVKFTLNTDTAITELTVKLNLVAWQGGWNDHDVAGAEYVFSAANSNEIGSTNDVDQEFTANIPFPASETYDHNGTIWTLDKSQDPGLRPNVQAEALRNDGGAVNTNYRLKFTLNGQTFTSTVTDGSGLIDTVILSTDGTAAVSKFEDGSASISPVPANSVLNVNGIESENYTVVDVFGRTVKVAPANGQLDVSDLANGVYILVTDEGNAKFIKN